ncbi:ABC transporter permease [Novipirellula artificiosorum]|uniref:ABC-2 family transporter protein n=1 Tax=Novipirellula artificiosorum TaxID=2528016 RepID=A0A5C6DLW2_9BACT|nr:ABC transporter permease subunit [Novipirellula artificiosorum]TWU37165.1 ABC-2 family transporter protein [Novipirellula artificiosorum]
MPLLAILSYELRGLGKSWLVRGWLVATALVTFFIVTANWGQTPTALLVAQLLFPYLVFPWFFVVLLLGLNPVTGSRLEALSDGILCRPVNRWEYLLASWAARVIAVLLAFAVVILPVVWIVMAAERASVPDDGVAGYGVAASLMVVGLVLTFLVSLGFFAGTLLKSPLFAAAVLILFWIPVNLVLHTFSLEEFSPISLNQSLPTLLRTPWKTAEADSSAQADTEDMQAAADQAADFLNLLTGRSAAVRQQPPEFFERGDYQDFSLLRVVMGYGLPTLACVGLATLLFGRRDL